MSKYKNKKPSLIDFTRKYANNEPSCEEFFFKDKYPKGYYCEKCMKQKQSWMVWKM